MTENSTQVVFDSPTTAIFLDLEMLDQLYTCVATATGFDSYNRTGLFNELSDAAHPGHNYAAYLASCVRASPTATRRNPACLSPTLALRWRPVSCVTQPSSFGLARRRCSSSASPSPCSASTLAAS
jgi:hypothetical protein